MRFCAYGQALGPSSSKMARPSPPRKSLARAIAPSRSTAHRRPRGLLPGALGLGRGRRIRCSIAGRRHPSRLGLAARLPVTSIRRHRHDIISNHPYVLRSVIAARPARFRAGSAVRSIGLDGGVVLPVLRPHGPAGLERSLTVRCIILASGGPAPVSDQPFTWWICRTRRLDWSAGDLQDASRLLCFAKASPSMGRPCSISSATRRLHPPSRDGIT